MNNFKATHFLEVPQKLQIHFLFFFYTDNVVVVEMLLIFYQSRNVVSSPTVQQNQSSQACKVCQVAIISSAHYTLCSPPHCGPHHHHTTGSSWENMLLRILPSSSLPHPLHRIDKQLSKFGCGSGTLTTMLGKMFTRLCIKFSYIPDY